MSEEYIPSLGDVRNPIIDSSYGSPTANCYVSFTDAHSITMSSVIDYDVWTSASTLSREIALVRATRDIDSMRWAGSRYFFNQALHFPRAPQGLGYWDRYSYGMESYGWNYGDFPWQYYGANLAATTINTFNVEFTRQEEAVKRATVYQALGRLRQKKGRNRHRERQASGITSYSESIGKLSESYSYGQTSLSLASESYDELREYVGSPTLIRG